MRVAIDISPLKSAHKTRGIGMYTRYLIESLEKFDRKNEYILTSKPNLKTIDLVHYPYFDFFSPTLPLTKPKGVKRIVTIHDAIPLIFPQHYKPGIRGRINFLRQRLALKYIDAIITDSDNSKRDIARYLDQPQDKIHRVYLAAAPYFKQASIKEIKKVKQKYSLSNEYALYVGDINYNKNLSRLIRAFAKIKNPLKLVLVARALKNRSLVESQEIETAIQVSRSLKKIVILTTVPLDPPQELRALYSGATVYIQPSLYEGFGLPLLEAMACGTPVISAKAASLPEVAGKAALYFNPEDELSMTQTIENFLSLKPEAVKALITKGSTQVRKFSWNKTAQNTIRVYQDILEDSRQS